jgi:hypothetical protein
MRLGEETAKWQMAEKTLGEYENKEKYENRVAKWGLESKDIGLGVDRYSREATVYMREGVGPINNKSQTKFIPMERADKGVAIASERNRRIKQTFDKIAVELEREDMLYALISTISGICSGMVVCPTGASCELTKQNAFEGQYVTSGTKLGQLTVTFK